MPKELIDDDRLFPRSEYYSRFEGTTAFVMADPDYWGTYHRSVSTRFSREVVGQNGAKFTSHCATKPKSNANSFHAHTGSILSPFSKNYYREVVELAEQASEYNINVRDKLSPITHEMVRACKQRGLALSLLGFFRPKPKNIKTEKKSKSKVTKKLSK